MSHLKTIKFVSIFERQTIPIAIYLYIISNYVQYTYYYNNMPV